MGSTSRLLLFGISCFLCAVALTTIYSGSIMTGGSHQQPKFEDGAQVQVNRRLDEMGKSMARLTMALGHTRAFGFGCAVAHRCRLRQTQIRPSDLQSLTGNPGG